MSKTPNSYAPTAGGLEVYVVAMYTLKSHLYLCDY